VRLRHSNEPLRWAPDTNRTEAGQRYTFLERWKHVS
jgi:hypothetical protein